MAPKKRKLSQKSVGIVNKVGKLGLQDPLIDIAEENGGSHSDASRKSPCSPDKRLPFSFYNQNCVTLAKSLLGKKLVRRLSRKELLSGIIVETEAYLGGEDKASHSHNGRKTLRNAAMFMPPGTAYVYNIYGMYTCLNISSYGDGAAVLIRALHADDGVDHMRSMRGFRRSDKGAGLKLHHLCNGPSKLTMALQIERANVDGCDMCSSDELWLEEGMRVEDEEVVVCKRVGIDSAGMEWACKPLRFYMRGNTSVSVRDKAAEAAQNTSSVIQK